MDDDRLIEIEEHQEDIRFDEDNTDEEEEEEDDDEYGEEEDDEDGEEEEDYEDEEVNLAERRSPRVSSLTSQSAVVINDGFLEDSSEYVGKSGKQENEGGDELGKKELNTSEIDVCPICFQAWTSAGEHRICCLPCGHIYGMSCINKWLLRCPSSGKCPQCKSLCTLKDVIVLYTTRLCVADAELHKASSNHFPPTEEGFSAFQQFVFSWLDSLRQRINALERCLDSLEQQVNDQMEIAGLGLAQESTR